MRNVPDVVYGGVRYGYVYQDKKTKGLRDKIETLESLGCTEIVCDIGDNKGLYCLLEKASFRDHIEIYDLSGFQTVTEWLDFIGISFERFEGDLGVSFTLYDKESSRKLGRTPEKTRTLRKSSILRYPERFMNALKIKSNTQ